MVVQFNHPGGQKHYTSGRGYRKIGNDIIREWNSEQHYRKFIQNSGFYLNDVTDPQPKQADLYFWGEWEGNSFFKPLKNSDYRIKPNGIHKPFHSTEIRGTQNTDPFVFGEDFKYAICKQTGQMLNLPEKFVILFGATFPSLGKFYIDTVFVVKHSVPAHKVKANAAKDYSKVYREETLEQLGDAYTVKKETSKTASTCLKPVENVVDTKKEHKIYHSLTWWDNKELFSFVPCKTGEGNNGFERLYIELNNPLFHLSTNPTGKSFLKECKLTEQQLWNEIVKTALKQGFQLGIRLNEPVIINKFK